MDKVLLTICGFFYALLCVFSIVTGLMYASGKKKLNPLELSDKFMSRYDDPDKLKKFTMKMGWVTFVVGIVQGITAFSMIRIYYPVCFWIALGFTMFSICSVAFKLKGKINAFPILKCIAYVVILAVILLIGRKYVGNRYPGYVSLNENGVMVPGDVSKIIIGNSSLYYGSYTDEEKISRILNYLNSIYISPETVLEHNYRRPVTVPMWEGDAFRDRRWSLRMETEDGWYDIVFFDNSGLVDIYKNYDIGYRELVSVSPCLGYVKEEDPPVNPVVRWWSIPQEQYDDLIILLKSLVPDKLPSNGYGFEEWRE